MIEVFDLHKAFGTVKAVDGVSFTAEDGKITGLLGPNGAGKTTLISTMSGLARATSGTIKITQPAEAVVGKGAEIGTIT